MKKHKLPQTDSIQELAQFWDTHDLSDFEDELEEVTEPIFVRRRGAGDTIEVSLDRRHARAVERIAQAEGVSREQLLRGWVLQKIARRTN